MKFYQSLHIYGMLIQFNLRSMHILHAKALQREIGKAMENQWPLI